MRSLTTIAPLAAAAALLAACGGKPEAPPPRVTDVTAMTVSARDVPVDLEFVAQTRSTREVEIRARVEGFLEKRTYKEGDMVKPGQVLFQMDRKPFEAALQSARGQLAQQQARLEVAKANLARIRPLAAENAVSKKDLDDAVGAEQAAQAAVMSAQGQVDNARINLGYTTIASPLSGLSSYARKQDGSYVTPGPEGLLTTVSALNPMEVNFSVSENEILRWREEIGAGKLKFPPNNAFEVEVTLADGSVYPHKGRITFIDPSFNPQTGTFLVRAEVSNPNGILKPGQFVRAKGRGAMRPNAIVVPQRAVLQGAKSHFVWVIDKEGKAEQRVVQAGQWTGDEWFVTNGLAPGERIVVDGAIRVSQGAPLKIGTAAPAAPPKAGETAPPDGKPAAQSTPPAARPAAGPTTQQDRQQRVALRMSVELSLSREMHAANAN
ncbi:MAG TPA: efflux RND transporter periplasmic adaptor subunit [Burkholderiales bacterium]|nr:efflux RND transporter periplasmic adaptor subunit [Burkholderiales bacterium]